MSCGRRDDHPTKKGVARKKKIVVNNGEVEVESAKRGDHGSDCGKVGWGWGWGWGGGGWGCTWGSESTHLKCG